MGPLWEIRQTFTQDGNLCSRRFAARDSSSETAIARGAIRPISASVRCGPPHLPGIGRSGVGLDHFLRQFRGVVCYFRLERCSRLGLEHGFQLGRHAARQRGYGPVLGRCVHFAALPCFPVFHRRSLGHRGRRRCDWRNERLEFVGNDHQWQSGHGDRDRRWRGRSP